MGTADTGASLRERDESESELSPSNSDASPCKLESDESLSRSLPLSL